MTKNTRFTNLYKKFFSPLTCFVFKRMGTDPDTADEIVSQTLIAAWKGFGSFKHKSTYFTWLCRIALNKIADYYRDQVHQKSHIVVPTLKAISLTNFGTLEANDMPVEEKLALSELCAKVNGCLNLLPHEKRRLLWYRYWRDMSYDQIAKVMDISVRAVEGRLYRAKESFAKVWTTKL